MTQQPVTPPSELLQLWRDQHYGCNKGFNELLIEAAQWGADRELEACCEWLDGVGDLALELRADRRPKPAILKEQPLKELESLRCDAKSMGMGFDAPAIRRALEQLPDQ